METPTYAINNRAGMLLRGHRLTVQRKQSKFANTRLATRYIGNIELAEVNKTAPHHDTQVAIRRDNLTGQVYNGPNSTANALARHNNSPATYNQAGCEESASAFPNAGLDRARQNHQFRLLAFGFSSRPAASCDVLSFPSGDLVTIVRRREAESSADASFERAQDPIVPRPSKQSLIVEVASERIEETPASLSGIHTTRLVL